MSHRTTTNGPVAGLHGRCGAHRPLEPTSLNRKSAAREAARDVELLEALRIAKEQLGEDHPLVQDALRSLAAKERRRKSGAGDGITAEVMKGQNSRVQQIANILTAILGETPFFEVKVPGTNMRVDMLFRGHNLVVEENGAFHRKPRIRERDARVRAACRRCGWQVLVVGHEESLTEEHLRARLAVI
jgi:hypothetical protein